MERIPWAMEGRPGRRPARRGLLRPIRLPRSVALVAAVGAALVWPNTGQGRNPWPPSSRMGGILSITLSKGTDLRFGEIFVGPSPGTCIVTPQGARSSTGGVGLGGAFSTGAASFTVGGDPLAAFSVTLPASATMTSGIDGLTVDSFTSDPSGAGQLDALGNQELTIGATLNVGANQAPGDYSGIFDITVAYN
jgi:Domain of unknown function (DUF4402)